MSPLPLVRSSLSAPFVGFTRRLVVSHLCAYRRVSIMPAGCHGAVTVTARPLPQPAAWLADSLIADPSGL